MSLLGPLLAPENYPQGTPPLSPPVPAYGSSATLASASPRPSQSGPRPPALPVFHNPNSPAPFDWLHFEGRSVKTTLSNITGLDGLARERKWRSHCVFSVDVGRKGRQGVEAVSAFPSLNLPCNTNISNYSSSLTRMYCSLTRNTHRRTRRTTKRRRGRSCYLWQPVLRRMRC